LAREARRFFLNLRIPAAGFRGKNGARARYHPTGDEVKNIDLIKGKQNAYRIKQVYPKYTTKTFHWVGLAMPISHTVQAAWPVRRPAATLIGESKD
jgi:hypothetical protein